MRPLQVRIGVRGTLSDRFAAVFDGLALEPRRPGQPGSVLAGVLPDSAALYGVLERLRDLGLDLATVVAEPVTAAGPTSARPPE